MSLREDQHPVLDLITQIAAGRNTEASAAFDDLMGERVGAAIDRAKAHIAATMFDDSATIGEDADDDLADEDEFIFLTQDEYDALSDEEKAEFEELPVVEGEDEIEEDVQLDEISKMRLRVAAYKREKQSNTHMNVSRAADRAGDYKRARVHDRAAKILSDKSYALKKHTKRKPGSTRDLDMKAIKIVKRNGDA